MTTKYDSNLESDPNLMATADEPDPRPGAEDTYWRENHVAREYVVQGRPYAEYQPAYKYGWESHARLSPRLFAEVEGELERGWFNVRGESALAWSEAKHAASDAWHRLENMTVPMNQRLDGKETHHHA